MLFDLTKISKFDGNSIDVDTDMEIGFEGRKPSFKTEKVHVRGTVTNINGVFHFIGSYHVSYVDQCSRCLEEIERELEQELDVIFAWPDKKTDEDMYVFTGVRMPLGIAIEDSIIMNVPSKDLCSKNCKGLCPECGCDLNVDKCDCERIDK